MALNLPFLQKDSKQREALAKKPINQFVAQVKAGGLARQNRFAVEFMPPVKNANADKQRVLLFCDTATLPGANYSTVQNRVFGEFRDVPYEKIYDNVNLTFYVDNELKVKQLFDDWMNVIMNPQSRTFNYYNNYVVPMTIQVQDLNDKTKYEMKLYECYPKTISSIQMDMNNKDVMKLQVTMQYKYWEAGTVTKLANDETVSTSLIDKFTKNFSGFQETLNKTLGSSMGNFVTGSAITYGVTKLPGLLKF